MDSAPLPEAVDGCGTDPGHARLLCLTDLLIASASDELLDLMQYEYSVEEAQKWSNLPAGAVPDRPGAYLGEFDIEQRGLIKAIMIEATGTSDDEGFDELVQTLNADTTWPSPIPTPTACWSARPRRSAASSPFPPSR